VTGSEPADGACVEASVELGASEELASVAEELVPDVVELDWPHPETTRITARSIGNKTFDTYFIK